MARSDFGCQQSFFLFEHWFRQVLLAHTLALHIPQEELWSKQTWTTELMWSQVTNGFQQVSLDCVLFENELCLCPVTGQRTICWKGNESPTFSGPQNILIAVCGRWKPQTHTQFHTGACSRLEMFCNTSLICSTWNAAWWTMFWSWLAMADALCAFAQEGRRSYPNL